MSDLTLRVLRVFAFDYTEQVWWRTDPDYAPVTFLVNCNDLFWWGTADCERVTEENIDLLEQTAAELDEDDKEFLGQLFVARWRKMRPQGAYYKYFPDNVKLLFDACGPERKTDFLNPVEKSNESL